MVRDPETLAFKLFQPRRGCKESTRLGHMLFQVAMADGLAATGLTS